MSLLNKLINDGFSISLFSDSFEITPASKLTDEYRQYLKTNKAEILAELKAKQIITKLVTCWTPNGNPMQVEADSEAHAEWLQLANPLNHSKHKG